MAKITGRANRDDVYIPQPKGRAKDDAFVPRITGRANRDEEAPERVGRSSNPPAWLAGSNLGSGAGMALSPAHQNAQQWSQQNPAYDAAYFENAANQDQARRIAAVMERGRDDMPRRAQTPLGSRGQGGGTGANNNAGLRLPAWLQPNPTASNPAFQGGREQNNMTWEEAYAAAQAIQNPGSWMGQNDPHHTMNPMIDYYPSTGPLLPWWALPTATPAPTVTPAPTPSRPSRPSRPSYMTYGGNWGGGGGGGGGGGWGDGWGDNGQPAWWDASMGLYSMRGW